MSASQKGSKYIKDVLDYCGDFLGKNDVSNVSVKDILGFEPPRGAIAFLPSVKCVPLPALFPVYDSLVVGIPKVDKINLLEDKIGLRFEDVVTLAHKGKLILFVDVDCHDCLLKMGDVIQQFVDNDVQFLLGGSQSILLALKTAESLGIDFVNGTRLLRNFSLLVEDETIKRDRERAYVEARKAGRAPGVYPYEVVQATSSLMICSMIKPISEYVDQLIDKAKTANSEEEVFALADTLYMTPMFLLAKSFNSTLSTNIACKHIHSTQEPQGVLDKSFDNFDPYELEFMEKKLKIAYSDQISISEYIDLFDSRTTDAIRTIVRRIISEAHTKGGSILNLQNSIDLYNQQVKEILSRSTKRTKILYATSDIVRSNAAAIRLLFEGVAEKYLNAPEKAWDCVAVPQKYRKGISKWLSEKAVRLESLLTGVSPDVIHLYHVRTCIERLSQKETTDMQPSK